jgi:hypothetical protein
MNREEIFTETYQKNLFQGREAKSGMGSDLENTKLLRERFVRFFNSFNGDPVSLLDAPCGDFMWVKEIINDLPIKNYIGIDIVGDMIKSNMEKYASDKVTFFTLDLCKTMPKEGDFLLCRDCLVHLSFKSIRQILKNFVHSDITYLLTTTFTSPSRVNVDFEDGTNWFPINLTKPPFNFPEPLEVIIEGCTEGGGEFTDKSLGLWKRKDLLSLCGN